MGDPSRIPRAALELRVRRRALANMEAVLKERADASAGRFSVERIGDDGFAVRFPAVRTLVRSGGRRGLRAALRRAERSQGTLSVAVRAFLFIVGVAIVSIAAA